MSYVEWIWLFHVLNQPLCRCALQWTLSVLLQLWVCLTAALSSLQSSQSGSAQRAPARGGASSWRRPNLQDAGVTICAKPTTAAAPTSMSTAWKQVSLTSACVSSPGFTLWNMIIQQKAAFSALENVFSGSERTICVYFHARIAAVTLNISVTVISCRVMI